MTREGNKLNIEQVNIISYGGLHDRWGRCAEGLVRGKPVMDACIQGCMLYLHYKFTMQTDE